MAALTVSRISGVILITQSPGTYPKYYSGASFIFQASNDNTTILLTATEPNGQINQYNVAYADLTVNSQGVPPSMAMAIAWLTDCLRP